MLYNILLGNFVVARHYLFCIKSIESLINPSEKQIEILKNEWELRGIRLLHKSLSLSVEISNKMITMINANQISQAEKLFLNSDLYTINKDLGQWLDNETESRLAQDASFVRRNIATMQQSLDNDIQKFNTLKTTQDHEFNEITKKLDEVTNNNGRKYIERRTQSLTQKIQNIKEQLKKIEFNNNTLKLENDNMESAIFEKTQEQQELTTEYGLLQKTIHDTQQQATLNNSNTEELNESIKRLTSKIEALKEEYIRKERELLKLQVQDLPKEANQAKGLERKEQQILNYEAQQLMPNNSSECKKLIKTIDKNNAKIEEQNTTIQKYELRIMQQTNTFNTSTWYKIFLSVTVPFGIYGLYQMVCTVILYKQNSQM